MPLVYSPPAPRQPRPDFFNALLRDLDIPYECFLGTTEGDKWEEGIPKAHERPMTYEDGQKDPDPWRVRARKLFTNWGFLKLGHWLDIVPNYRSHALGETYLGHWLLEESLWYLAIQDNEDPLLEPRAGFIADIYHSLGAASLSLTLAFGLYVFQLFMRVEFTKGLLTSCQGDISFVRFLAYIGCSILIYFSSLWILRSCRRVSKWNLVALKRHCIVYFLKHPKCTRTSLRRRFPPLRRS
jgi:hypothetical protein